MPRAVAAVAVPSVVSVPETRRDDSVLGTRFFCGEIVVGVAMVDAG